MAWRCPASQQGLQYDTLRGAFHPRSLPLTSTVVHCSTAVAPPSSRCIPSANQPSKATHAPPPIHHATRILAASPTSQPTASPVFTVAHRQPSTPAPTSPPLPTTNISCCRTATPATPATHPQASALAPCPRPALQPALVAAFSRAAAAAPTASSGLVVPGKIHVATDLWLSSRMAEMDLPKTPLNPPSCMSVSPSPPPSPVAPQCRRPCPSPHPRLRPLQTSTPLPTALQPYPA